MGVRLTDGDEGVHQVGGADNWNESRYVDFWDPERRVGGWFRIGMRPNQGYAEVSSCLYLPDRSVAFGFDRAPISGNGLEAGGQSWEIVEPWRTNRVRYRGEMSILDDPWMLKDPKTAFTSSPRAEVDVDLSCRTEGLEAVMGQDQDHKDLIFLPGQADFHYQHLTRVIGTVRVGGSTFAVDGRGGKDHSWGPRNWHAKIYLRWLIAAVDDANGFMLLRAVGPTKQTRGGFVWTDRRFALVDEITIANDYAGPPHYELRAVDVTLRAGEVEWTATGTVRNYLPARHRQTNEAGEEAILRIVKQPTDWVLGDGRTAVGHCEYHDLLDDGVPVGLHD